MERKIPAWEKRFDKLFGNKWRDKNDYLPPVASVNAIKDFIRTLLAQEKRKREGRVVTDQEAFEKARPYWERYSE